MPENDSSAQQPGGTAAVAKTVALAAGPDNHLAPGTRLGEFEILELIGEGGFGIVYLAYDHSLQRKVALKEYMPAQLASRAQDASVSVRAEKFTETFEMGRRSFVNEARLLAQFDQPALVKVHRFWEANGTAYMAMPFYEGITLREARKRMVEAPPLEWIRAKLAPVMDALELIHGQQCFHRDIAPDNIMLLGGERPVLLDFGAARKVISDATQALTVILKPGYAPIEQYAEVPGMRQGAWTDVYALAAVIHFLITAETPPVAVGRIVHDEYRPLVERCAGQYPQAFLAAVDRCLAVRPEARPQDIAEARRALGFGEALLEPTARPAAAPPRPPAPSPVASPVASSGSRSLANLGIIGGIAALAALAIWFLLAGRESPPPPPSAAVEVPPAPAAAPLETPAAPPPAAPTPAPRLAAVTVDQAFAALVEQANPALAPSLEGLQAIRAPEGQALALSAGVPRAGYLYLMVLDRERDELALIFPNSRDDANALAPPQRLILPRPGWTEVLGSRPRRIEVLALFAESPRDFSGLEWRHASDRDRLPLAELETLLARGEGVKPLAGTPKCAQSPCAQGFGAASAALDVMALAPPRPAPNPPAAAAAPAEPSAGDAARLKAEQEYVRKLNRDLDKLLAEPAR